MSHSKTGKIVSPIKIIDRQTIVKTKNNQTSSEQAKRSLSSSPITPTISTVVKKITKIFITANRYNVLDDNVGGKDVVDICVNDNTKPTSQVLSNTITYTSTKVTPSSCIFVKDVQRC